MKKSAFLLAASLVAGVPLLCSVVAPAQSASKTTKKMELPSASQILAKLPAPTKAEAEAMMMYSGENQAFFGAEFVEGKSKMAPDAARLAAWKTDAKRYREAGGAPTAAAWLQLEARRAAILAPAPKAPTSEEMSAPGFDTASLHAEMEPTPGFASSVNLLPAPDQWRALLQGARESYEDAGTAHNAAVYYFAARLNGDESEQIAALRALYRVWAPQFRADLSAKTEQDQYGGNGARRVALDRDKALAKLLLSSPDAAQQQQGLRCQLQLGELLSSNLSIEIPDIAKEWGAAKARAFLPEILRSKAQLQWYGAGQTANLAREVWLNNPALQTQPQWQLAWSAEPMNLPFSLKLLEKFAPKKGGEQEIQDFYNYLSLQSSVLQALIKRDEFARADALLAQWNRRGQLNSEFSFYLYDNDASLAQQRARLSWMEATLTRYPQLNWWNAYRNLALTSGQSQHALNVVRARLNNPKIANRGALQSALASLYLDSGAIEKGGALLASQVRAGTRAGNDFDNRAGNIANLLRLTRVAPHAQWLQIARAGAQSLVAAPLNAGNGDAQIRQIADIALQLHEQNQSVFAAQMLAQGLIKASAKPEEYYSRPDAKPYLYALMTIYRDENRADDALYLLENARGWGAAELSPLLTYRGEQQWDGDHTDIDFKARAPLGELAAWAMSKNNQRAKAVQVARATLQRAPGNDGVYALLVDLQGQSAVPFLKELQARDPYEERPLIWQAELARRAGNLTQAAILAEKAIAVDPSDGEQPRGDRLLAYSELARVRRAQGNDARANELAAAVQAIRLSETADKWRIAGVAPRAIALYRRSLRLFDNAYCVQSRLAVELTSQGEFAQAAQHFERAYQLMPVSFGRMESHCFGCEGVFGDAKSEPIARRVFRQLESAQPNNAKVQYLAGYWRMSAGQTQAATKYFQRAVKLDPLYLSAWKQLASNKAYQSPLEQDAATLAVLRLDPASQHDDYGASFEINQNFRGLWSVTKAVLPRIRPNLNANFPLPNSSNTGESYNTWELVTSPANAIARQSFVDEVNQLSR